MRLGRRHKTIDTVLFDQPFTLTVSDEQQFFAKKIRCPRCRRRIWHTTSYEPGGRVRRIRNPTHPLSLVECPRCHGRWFFFTQPIDITFIESRQSIEEDSAREIVLDNRRGVSPLIRKQTVTQEWTQTYELERETTDTQGTKLTAGVEKGPSIEVTAEQAVKERYSISEEKKEIYTEELSFEVPPGVLRTVRLTFKLTWQEGTVRVVLPDVRETVKLGSKTQVEVPFRVVVDVTMDSAQTDTPQPGHGVGA